jgi:formate hydrogenlyase transcriptional activator
VQDYGSSGREPFRSRGSTGTVAVLSADALLLQTFDAIASAVLVVGPDGEIAGANQALLALFGYSRRELIGRRADILLPSGVLTASSAGNHSRSERDVAPTPGLIGRRRDGCQFALALDLKPLQTPRGTFVVATIADADDVRASDGNAGAMAGQLEFERLIAEVSVKCINLPADQIQATIEDALRRIGEELDLDRCSMYRVPPDGVLIDPVSWARPGFDPMPLRIAAAADFPWAFETVTSGNVMCFSTVDEIPNAVDRENYRAFGILSGVAVPLSVRGSVVGAVCFNRLRKARPWKPQTVHRLRLIAATFASVLARQRSDEALRAVLAEVGRLRDQLQAENIYLRREVEERLGGGVIVGQSAAVRRVLEQVQQVAPTHSTVLLLGETGTGKELFATHIHELSDRRARSMVRVNCAAIPATLMESELFGREKGAFTGALAQQAGRFETANHSTIFLDEIGDVPQEVQVKLLRVLEQRQIERLGNPRAIPVDVRIVAATHRDLERLIGEGTFREDLFYRLNVFPVRVPPLRERVEDIPLLVWRFVDEFSKAFGKRIEVIPRETMAALQEYAWPGNIRELRNVVERAMIVSKGPRLAIGLPMQTAAASKRSLKLADVEKEHIRHVLDSSGWRVRGTGGAADRLGLRPTTLEARMAKLGLTRPRPA